MLRSELARRFYPNAHPEDAGAAVVHLIMNFPALRRAMERSGYVPKKPGYSAKQVEILMNFWSQHHDIHDIRRVGSKIKHNSTNQNNS